MEQEQVNVLTLKWGTLYPASYVNRVYRAVKKNLHRPFRFVCITDNAEGLDEGIDAQPIPEKPKEFVDTDRYFGWPNIYIKIALFKDGCANLKGPTLFLDIDQIITGELDSFFDYKPGKFCIVHNWIELRKRLFRKRPFVGNSSCFRFEAGKMGHVYEKWLKELPESLDTSRYQTEQVYMTHAVGEENVNWWPEEWVTSFKRSCQRVWPLNHFLVPKLRANTKILCFHGNPNPDEAINGYKGKHLNTWVRPCPWVKELWEINDK